MYTKKLALPILVLLFPVFVLAVQQNVTVDVLAAPSIYLGNSTDNNSTIDADGIVFATLGNNQAFACQIDWENGFADINPNITFTNHTYYSIGLKTVFYRCKGKNQNFVTVNDSINVLNAQPLITLIEPVLPAFNKRQVLIDLTVNKGLVNLQLQIDNGSRLFSLCRNCNKYNRTRTFDDGYHNITLIATDKSGFLGKNVTTFFIDATKPRIINTDPRNNGYTNGNFTIVYDEDFLKNITLFYDNKSLTKTDCLSTNKTIKRMICEFNVDLSEFDNKTISYYFEIRDRFFSDKQRRGISVKVDTTKPEINQLTFNIKKNNVKFNITISEKVDLSYFDLNINKSKWTNLCTHCAKYDKNRFFNKGMHNLIVKATDNALNTDQKNISFSIL